MMEVDSSKVSLQDRIETILASGKGTKINLCYAIYKLIEQASPADAPRLLQFTAEIIDTIESSEEISTGTFISTNEEEVLKDRYGELVDGMLKLLINDNPEEMDFYEGIWSIVNNPVLKDERARVFAFYYILIDSRIPYFHLEQGLKMANEDFQRRIKRLTKKLAKIRFILVRDFSQRTEGASLLVQELNSENSFEDQVILMSWLLSEFRRREQRLMNRLRDYRS